MFIPGQSASTVELAQSYTLSKASNETEFVVVFSLARHNVLPQFECFLQSDYRVYSVVFFLHVINILFSG